MARRYDHTPDELRELAIQSGISIIDEQGFSKLSARGVAAKMGYTVGTLYHLFGSLDLYVLNINARTLDEWHQTLTRSLATNRTDPIRVLAKGYITFSKTHRNRFIALFEYQLPESIEIPGWYKSKMNQLFELVESAMIQEGMSDKKAQHLAKVVWASIHGITILSLTGKLEVVGADSVERLTETVIAGLLRV